MYVEVNNGYKSITGSSIYKDSGWTNITEYSFDQTSVKLKKNQKLYVHFSNSKSCDYKFNVKKVK